MSCGNGEAKIVAEDEDAVSEGRIGRIRVSAARWLQRAAALALLGPLQLAIVRDLLPRALTPPAGAMGAGLGVAIALSALSVWIARLGMRGRAGRLRVDGSHLVMEGSGRDARIPRRSIVGAWALASKRRVEIELSSGDFVFAEGPGIDPEELVRALGFGPATRAVALPSAAPGTEVYVNIAYGVLGPMLALVGGSLLSGPLGLLSEYVRVLPTVALATTFLLGAWTHGPGLRIGVDGVRMRRPLRWAFEPFDATSTVERRGAQVTLRTGNRSKVWTFVDPDYADAIHHRIESVLRLRREAPERPGGLAAIERHGDDVRAWRRRIDAREASPAYRSYAIPAGDLELVLASADASPEDRIAAALALGDRIDDHARARLRVAAATSVRPEVRRAFERLADGDPSDDELEAALEDPPPPLRLRA